MSGTERRVEIFFFFNFLHAIIVILFYFAFLLPAYRHWKKSEVVNRAGPRSAPLFISIVILSGTYSL